MDLGMISKRATNHRFIISLGNYEISSEELWYYKDCIHKLGGMILDCSAKQFISSCTHVLCFSLTSSVKIMGGLASGKWLVDKKYIDDSVRSNKFLPEDNYEVNYYDNVSKYCRLRNSQLYSGYIFYLETENNYKSYKRVLVAGGAIVLSKEEAVAKTFKIDYAFCDKTTYPSVKAILSNRPTVPILNLDYMRYTIFLKHNPRDIRQFLVDNSQNIEITGTALDENEKVKKVQELIERRASFNKLQLTPRTLKRTTVRGSSKSPNVQGTTLRYLVNTESLNNKKCVHCAKKARSTWNNSSSDIEILGEYPSSTKNKNRPCLDNSAVNILHTSELSRFSSQICSSVESNVIPICEVKLNRNTPIVNGYEPTSIIKKSMYNIKNNLQCEVKSAALENHCIKKVLPVEKAVPSHSKNCSNDELLDLNEKDVIVSLLEKENRIEKNHFNEKDNFDMLEVIPYRDPTDKMEVHDLLESVHNDLENLENTTVDASSPPNNNLKLLSSDSNKNEIGIFDTVIPMCDNNDMTKQKTNKGYKREKKEIFLQNKTSLLQAGQHTIKLDFHILLSTYRKFLAKLNTSYYMLLNNMMTIPKASCTTVIKAVELIPKDTILHNTIFDFDNLRICSEKVGRYVLKVAKMADNAYDEEDALVALCYLQWLQCQIQREYYPNAKVIADLIRLYIMKIPFDKVRKQALNLFGELISLHPPHTVSLRNYYINVFSNASSDKMHQGNNKAWEFMSSVIEKALPKPSTNEDCDLNKEFYCAFLSFIIHILEMDLIYYNDRPVTIRVLVCYRIFWPTKMDNPSVVNSAVRNLLQFWTQSIDSDEIVRSHLTRLLSILLEMLWKWSELSNPLLFAEWPLDRKWMSVANEVLVKFRGFDDITPLLQFLKYIEMPWQRLFLSSLIYRVLQPSFQKASLTNIKDSLGKLVYECKVEQNLQMKSESCTPHHTVTELLCIMFVSYIDSSGQKSCINDICHQLRKSLHKEVLNCSSQGKEEPTLTSYEPSSLKRKHSDDSMASLNSQSKYSIQQIVSENISMESNGITKGMVIKMLDVFRSLPKYVKSFEGYSLECSHIKDARIVENLHYN